MNNRETSPRVKKIRVSIGTAGVLGLLKLHSDAEPTTAYLMTYTQRNCRANCAFCPQARQSSSSKELLSRVVWPAFPLALVVERIATKVREKKLRRVCMQSLNFPGFAKDISEIASSILSKVSVPISISCPPVPREKMEALKQLGVERIGLPIDGATQQIFDSIKGSAVKGPYHWQAHIESLKDALDVFGANKVSTHIIIGLGETEQDAVNIIQKLYDIGVNPSLFAFTPIKGTKLGDHKRPRIDQYRRVQLARYVILQGASSAQSMRFNSEGKIVDFGVSQENIDRFTSLGDPFMTAGCPNCNRPFYTESPMGPIYNYPRRLSNSEIRKALDELKK
jgi:biotin synthase